MELTPPLIKVGTITRVGFVRIKPVDIWGFRNDPEWHAFQGHVSRPPPSLPLCLNSLVIIGREELTMK